LKPIAVTSYWVGVCRCSTS